MTTATPSIPLIDFSDYLDGTTEERERVIASIGAACQEYGFFYLRNYGIDPSIVSDVFAQSDWFFGLSPEEKLKSAQTADNASGYVPRLEESATDDSDAAAEFFMMMENLAESAPGESISPLHLPNRWPANNAEFRRAMTAYYRACSELSSQLLEVFSLALGLPAERLARLYRRPIVNMQLNYYRGQSTPDGRRLGVGAHRDKGGLTILITDEVGGLEVRKPDGQWLQAPFIPDAAIINVGNMLMMQTNDRFASVVHRVINTEQRARKSIPFFLNPDWEAQVSPEPELLSPAGPSRYREPLEFGPWFHRTIYGSQYNTREDITIAFAE